MILRLRHRQFGLLAGALMVGSAHAQSPADLPATAPAARPVVSGCPIASTARPEVLAADDVELSATELDATQTGTSVLRGDVQLRYAGMQLSAPELRYNANTGEAATRGGAAFANQQFHVGAADASVDVDAGTASFEQAQFELHDRGARGSADTLSLHADLSATLAGVHYTSCAPQPDEQGVDRPDWELRASNIQLNPRDGLGTASQAQLWFKGVPIMYAPYFYFPIDNRRRTGFLVPSIGDSANTGFEVSVPFYWNIAPAYDALLTPRYMARRGIQFQNQLRYLLHEDFGRGTLAYDYLPNDESFADSRSRFAWSHSGRLSDRWGATLDFEEVSDPGYFEDLGSTLNLSAITHLKRELRFAYQAPAWFSGELTFEDYQTIDRSVQASDEPYRRAPRLRLSALSPRDWNNIRAGMDLEAVSFQRADAVEGLRVDANPVLRYRQDAAGWFAGLQGSYRFTHYSLRHRNLADPTLGQDLSASSFRSLPTVVADGGLRFDRRLNGGLLQTLEPRVQYVYTPFESQSNLPVFDTALPDFSFVQLFTPNRFLGVDRIADTNQITGALTTRLLNVATGRTVLEAELGQIYRLRPSSVALPQPGGEPPPIEDDSEIVATLRVKPSEALSLSLGAQYDRDERAINRGYAGARWQPRPGMRLGASYRYRRDVLEQADVQALLPIASRWSIAGRWNYSILDEQTREGLIGVEYRSCCWTGQIAARRYIANTLGEFNTSLYFQLELLGLTRVGTSIASLLPD